MQTIDLRFWRVWVDEQGVSHQTRHAFNDYKQSVFAEGATSLWNAIHYIGPATIITLILMPGDLKDWHENPKPQWIITLNGTWCVETMDGCIVEMGPGEISFGGDQGTLNNKGHRSWAVGDTPVELMLIQVSEPPPWNPCNSMSGTVERS